MLVNGVVKLNEGGRTRVVEECSYEGQRIEALRKWSEVQLFDEEREGIRGHGSELKG